VPLLVRRLDWNPQRSDPTADAQRLGVLPDERLRRTDRSKSQSKPEPAPAADCRAGILQSRRVLPHGEGHRLPVKMPAPSCDSSAAYRLPSPDPLAATKRPGPGFVSAVRAERAGACGGVGGMLVVEPVWEAPFCGGRTAGEFVCSGERAVGNFGWT
jgi:hypothetical protein